MLKKVLIGFVALIVILVLVGFVLPQNVSMDRSITIDAPPAKIFGYLSSVKEMQKWSPWVEKDPNAKYKFEGPDHGVGAKVSWEGNDDVGTGSQIITAVKENQRVDTDLDFGEQGKAKAHMIVKDLGDGKSEVTWGFESDLGSNPVGRWFGVFLEGMLAPDYEAGLAKLKALAETKD